MWKKLFALAVTLPMTITIASAQAAQMQTLPRILKIWRGELSLVVNQVN